MHKVGLLNNGQPSGYASALFIGTHRGQKMVFHGGAWQGFRAEMVRFPALRLSVICLANLGTTDATALALQVADLYLPKDGSHNAIPSGTTATATPSAAPTFAIPEADWAKFPGRYKADSGSIWTLTRSGDQLAILSTSGLRFAARPIGALEFESTDRPQRARLVFDMDADGKIAGITQTMADTPDVHLKAMDAMTDLAAGLSDFEGMYDSDEAGGWMSVTASGGQLRIKHFEGFDAYPVGRDEPNTFSVPGLELVFTRGSDGQVDGIIVNKPRTKGIRYVKRPAC